MGRELLSKRLSSEDVLAKYFVARVAVFFALVLTSLDRAAAAH